ncbi:hypothetical protein LSAT2_014282 [Lamellibrachia satsuma]|nr:hypothetical protein LSAT2_014282 [Lamellibrachia satsuma]
MKRLTFNAVLLTALVITAQAYVNIAWNRPAYQTSVWGHCTANLAVDGNPDGNFNAGSCTATLTTGYPWWAVDFGTERIVSKVKISNRQDHLYSRLHDFTVGLTDTLPTTTTGPDMSPHQVCVIYNGVFPAAAMTLMCKHFPRGRYLFIQINGLKGELLTLCEVEVYCDPVNVVAIATGFREFGDCAVFTDHNQTTCAEVTSSDNPLDFILKVNVSKWQNTSNVRVTLRNGDCSDNNQVHVYTEEKPLYGGQFDGYFRRCQLAAAEWPADGATVCSFSCVCTKRGCDYVTVRIFGRYGPIRSLCEVELM